MSRSFSCLLLEAGGDDADPVVREHDQWWNCYEKEGLTWDFLTAPQPHLADSRRLEPRMGKLLGGSTSHNAMYGRAVDRWVRWYNEERPRQALGYLSPREYQAQQLNEVA